MTTFARRMVFLILTGAAACACLFDGSGYSGGAPDGGAPDATLDRNVSLAQTPDALASSDAGVDASFFHSDASVLWPNNGHYYEIVVQANIDWDGARGGASARGGHLATMASEDENLFVWYLCTQHPEMTANYDGPWIGGRQADGAVEPAGGWGWITGEPFAYTNWAAGEPNNAKGNENVIGYINGATWADYLESSQGPGYVVEYEPSP